MCWYNGFQQVDEVINWAVNLDVTKETKPVCLSGTYKDQHWDYACLVVLIFISFRY